jgi:hypothetical protein
VRGVILPLKRVSASFEVILTSSILAKIARLKSSPVLCKLESSFRCLETIDSLSIESVFSNILCGCGVAGEEERSKRLGIGVKNDSAGCLKPKVSNTIKHLILV